jgi:DNA-directed RNA polymerase alpha subunit
MPKRGNRPINAKWDRNQEILERYEAGENSRKLAAEYGICRWRVIDIVHCERRWRDKERQHFSIVYTRETPVDSVDLTVRGANCLANGKYRTIGEVMRATDEDLLSVKNLGKKTLREIRERCRPGRRWGE